MLPLALFLIFGSSFWNRNSSSSKDVVTGYMTFPCAAGTRHCRFYLPIPRLEGMEDFCQLEASKLTEVQQSRSLGLKKKQTTEAKARNLSFEKLHREVPSKLSKQIWDECIISLIVLSYFVGYVSSCCTLRRPMPNSCNNFTRDGTERQQKARPVWSSSFVTAMFQPSEHIQSDKDWHIGFENLSCFLLSARCDGSVVWKNVEPSCLQWNHSWIDAKQCQPECCPKMKGAICCTMSGLTKEAILLPPKNKRKLIDSHSRRSEAAFFGCVLVHTWSYMQYLVYFRSLQCVPKKIRRLVPNVYNPSPCFHTFFE